MGLVAPSLLVLQQLSRSGLSANNRGFMRPLYESVTTSGFTAKTVDAFVAFGTSMLDNNVLLKMSSDALESVCSSQLVSGVHPVLPLPGTCTRVLYPPVVKSTPGHQVNRVSWAFT